MEILKKYGYINSLANNKELNSSIKCQKRKLIQNGIHEKNIFVEIESGKNEIKNRSVFQKLINQQLRKNDLLMITNISICSRNTVEFLKLQNILLKKNIIFVVLDLPTSVDLSTNKLTTIILAHMFEFEDRRRKNLQQQGIREAKKNGRYKGRKTIITKTLIQKVKYLKENKNLSVTEISKLTKVSSPTIYKILKKHLGYISNQLVKVK